MLNTGRIITPGRPLGKVGPVTTFRFNAVNADAVRFVVFSMEDARQVRGEGYYYYNYSRELNGIRLVEIEVTGAAGVPSSAPMVAAAPDPNGAAGMLVGDLMAAANTPSLPTKVEPTILPGRLASNLIGGTKPTSTSPTDSPADRVEEPKPQSANPLAPYFELISPVGEPIRLSEYAGKAIVLHFWSMSPTYAYDATAAGVLVV
ncbi:MAG: hypothetical protein ABGY41_05995 [Candidatus Poribacteria bacterium]